MRLLLILALASCATLTHAQERCYPARLTYAAVDTLDVAQREAQTQRAFANGREIGLNVDNVPQDRQAVLIDSLHPDLAEVRTWYAKFGYQRLQLCLQPVATPLFEPRDNFDKLIFQARLHARPLTSPPP